MVLGSGTSFGVPVIGCRCRVCTSPDPRDRRTRVGAVVEGSDGRRILIDTPPDLRTQLLREGIETIDAVLYTHEHADHVHGVDDLRAVSQRRGAIPVYGPPATLACLARRFRYIFDQAVVPPKGTSKPELQATALVANRAVTIAGIDVLPLALDHGGTPVFGYRIGSLAYLTDVKQVPADAHERLRGVRVVIVNALFERPHPTHLSIPEALELIASVGAERAYLTHLTHEFTHQELAERLPAGVEPAHDGLVVTF